MIFNGRLQGTTECSEVFETVGINWWNKTAWYDVELHCTASTVWTFDRLCGHSCGRGIG